MLSLFSRYAIAWILELKKILTSSSVHRLAENVAGKNMTEHYHSKGTADENIEDLDISTKSCQSDFATAIDVKNENYIAGEIKRNFPTHEVR